MASTSTTSNIDFPYAEVSFDDLTEDTTQPGLGGGFPTSQDPFAVPDSTTTMVGFSSSQLPTSTPLPPGEFGTCHHTAQTSTGGHGILNDARDGETDGYAPGQLGTVAPYRFGSSERIQEQLTFDDIDTSINRQERRELEKLTRERLRQLPSVEFNGITFSLYDKEVEQMGIEITKDRDPYNKDTVNDPRLGVVSGTQTCRTCYNTLEHCTGHLGWVRLNRFYSPKAFKALIVKVLNCICITCKRLLVNMEDLKKLGLWKYKDNDPNGPIIWTTNHEARLRRIEDYILRNKSAIKCKRVDTSSERTQAGGLQIEISTGSHACMKNPDYKLVQDRIHYIIEHSGRKKSIPLELEQIRYILKQIPEWEYLITERTVTGVQTKSISETDYEEIQAARKRKFLTEQPVQPGSFMAMEQTASGLRTVILTSDEQKLMSRRFTDEAIQSDGSYLVTEQVGNTTQQVPISAATLEAYKALQIRRFIGSLTPLPTGGYLVTEGEEINAPASSASTSVTAFAGTPTFLPISEYRRIKEIQARDILTEKKQFSDSQIMGFDPPAHPKKLVMRYLVVPPLCVRPPTTRDGQESPDDITQQLITIVRQNNILKEPLGLDVRSMGPSDMFPAVVQPDLPETSRRGRGRDDPAQKLANQIHALFFGAQANTTRREFVSIRKLLQGKHGMIRKFMTGKRGDYGARTVLSPGPELEYGEIGLPRIWASTLTMPETVTHQNMAVLMSLMHQGKVSKIRLGGDQERFITVHPGQIPDYHLKVGDIVERHLQDGDYVAFNRNPSLHKFSIMGYRVKLHDDLTIRVNINVTPHHNADFDGDEGNIFLPRTPEAIAELQTVMSSRYCIQSGQDNKPLTGLIFNDLTAAYKLTREGVIVNEYTWQECMAILNREERLEPADQLVTLSRRIAKHQLHPRSGRALFSALLPPDFAYRKGKFTIVDGILTGNVEIDKGTAGATHRSILQFIMKNYGLERAALFLSDSQFVLKRWLKDDPVTTSLADCYPKVDPSTEVYPLYEIFNNETLDLYEATSSQSLNDFKQMCIEIIGNNTDYAHYDTINDRISQMDSNIVLNVSQILISGILPPDFELSTDGLNIRRGLFLTVVGNLREAQLYRQSISMKSLYEDKRSEALKQANEMKDKDPNTAARFRQDSARYQAAIEQQSANINRLSQIIMTYKLKSREYREGILKALASRYGNSRAFAFRRDLNLILSRCFGVDKRGGKHYEMIRREHERAKAILERYGPELNDPTKRDRASKFVIAQLDSVTRVGEQTMKDNFDPENNFSLIVNKAKTKGGGANIGQIAAFLGPQFKGSELIATSGDNIYQAEGDLDPEVFGFIIGNFLEGMSPLEFFWHAMAAREGMVDTSIKTADPGKLTRELIKTFEDVIVNHDKTVRLGGGPIIQSIYGGTQLDPEKLINVDFPDGTIPFFIDVESVANRLNSKFYQRTRVATSNTQTSSSTLVQPPTIPSVANISQPPISLPTDVSNVIVQPPAIPIIQNQT